MLQQKLQEQQHLLLLRQQDAGIESETAVAAAQAAQEAAAAIAAAAAGKEDYSWVGKPGMPRGRTTKVVSGSEFRPHRKRMVVAPPTSTPSAPLLAAMHGVSAGSGAVSTAALPTAVGGRVTSHVAPVPSSGAHATTASVQRVLSSTEHAKTGSVGVQGTGVSSKTGASTTVPSHPATVGTTTSERVVPAAAASKATSKTASKAKVTEEPEETTEQLEAAVATASYYEGVSGEFPPAQSAWFKIGGIHEIERLALPEFFDGRRAGLTPATYKAMRDLMIRTSLENPAKHLSFTHCRRLVGGEISAVYRVYQFLDHWGLVNSLPTQAFESTSGAQALGVPFPGTFDDVAGAVGTAMADAFLRAAAPEDTAIKVEEDAPDDRMDDDDDDDNGRMDNDDRPLNDGKNVEDGADDSASADVPIKQDPDAPQGEEDNDEDGEAAGGTSGAESGALEQHAVVDNTLVTHYSIFGDAQIAGGGGMSAGDGTHSSTGGGRNGDRGQGAAARRLLGEWVRMDEGDMMGDGGAGGGLAGDVTSWTEQETALLLQGVLEHPDDWDAIEELVGSKSRQQCVMQFLRLPLADVGTESSPRAEDTPADAPKDVSEPLPETLLAFLADCFEDPAQGLGAVDAAKAVLAEGGAGDGRTDAEVDLEAIVLAALAAASIKAEALAAVEEHEMRLLVLEAAALQLQKLDIKLRQLVLYEGCIEDEWVLLERARVRVLSQRILFVRDQLIHHPPSTTTK